MLTELNHIPFQPTQTSSLTMFFSCGLPSDSQSCFPLNLPQFYPDPTKPFSQTCTQTPPSFGICARVPTVDYFDREAWLRETTFLPGPTTPGTVPLTARFRGLTDFGAAQDHFESVITLNLDLQTGLATPVVPTGDGFLFNIVKDGQEPNHFCAIFETGSSPGNICFAIDVVSGTATQGFAPFRVQNIFYDPPGGLSVQQYGTSYTVSTSTNWQTVDKLGVVTSTGVKVGFDELGSITDSGQLQYQWEVISGGGVGSSRTDLTAVNVSGHGDIPSGLFDQFYLALGIPVTIVTFPDNRPVQVTANYAVAKQVILSGQQLMALAQAAPNVDDFLRSTPAITDQALIDVVKGQISPANARSILLLDPNFFTASDGSIVLRSASQLNQVIQGNADRFPPVPVSLGAISIPGTIRSNTLPVPPAPQPNNPAPTNNFTQQLSNSTSASNSNGGGTDFQLQVTTSTEFPIYEALSGQASAGTAFEEEYQKVTTTTTSPGTQDSVTPQMISPCLQGLVDIYYDSVFGTYLYVSHDISFIPKPPNSDIWFPRLCGTGNLGSPEGTACSANGDCSSQVCTNGICAPPACSPACPVGQPCGLGGPFGDCGSQNCNIGVCAASLFMSGCSVDGDCVTQSCVSSVCGAPACAPHCQQAAGCGVNGDCNSQFCSDGICLPPACSPTCAEGAACGANGDCTTRNCANGVCAPPACSPHCAQGSPCALNGECGSLVCTNNACVPPPCSGHCGPAVGCGANADCASRVCTGGVCLPPSCSGHCNQGTFCGANGDCGSRVCTNGLCAPPACSHLCGPNAACGVNADCASLVCTNNLCRAPSCSPHCNDGAACGVSGDCNSRVCTSGTCRAPACSPNCATGAACGANAECRSRVCNNGICR
jgi:hypothetical protein